ncbi:MAG: Gldg family protein [Myxococcota bacterium]
MGVSSLLGALGGVSILFALASFLMALMGVVQLSWSIVHGVVGVVLLASGAAINLDALRERMRSGEARRASKYGSSAVLSTLLAIAMLGMGGFLANRYPVRFDWSEQQVHSLTDQTQKVLAGLDDDVTVVGLFARTEVGGVQETLDRYSYETERFIVEVIADPNEQPDLLERYAINPEQLGQGLLRLAYRDEVVTVDELSEQNITNAIVKLTRTGEKMVYFLEGHNERAIDADADAEAAKDAYSRAAEALRNENYQVERLLLAAKGEVPDDADVVIVAGPTRNLHAEESAALDAYLRRGGALLALVDPRANTDLVGKLAEWGVALGEDVVVDRELALFGRATTPFAGQYAPDHPITQDMRDTTLFHVVRSVKQREGAAGSFTEIVLTGENSWAERDVERFYGEGDAELGAEDLLGPVPIAVAGNVVFDGAADADAQSDAADADPGNAAEARLAVFGDADFASNELLGTYRNRDLFVNTVNWLLGDVEAISLRPNTSRASRFQLSTAQFQTIRIFSLFALPEALAVLGVLTWWSRRQNASR